LICANCGTENEPTAKFCIQCGARQSVTCSVCGHANLPGARFCAECGSAMPGAGDAAAQAQAATAANGAVAERRLVSVLFADLVGFTTLSEERDPEETRELLSRYFDVARRTVEGHGGTVEKFIGDAVMAVWGAPVAHEDDAERAVRAALELVAAVPAIHEGETPLHARAGVLTGEAAVTLGAQGQGMVAGDLVNTASRLQSVAPPGSVLVGEATYRAASNAVSFERVEEQHLKGKAAPIPAWRALAVVARRGGSGRSSTLEPPFVGREDELRLLKDLFDATARERKPRLVTVIGQAGIGKSRLAWEFEKYLDGIVETAYWHEGRSPAYGEGISYWALAEMVRRRAGIAEGADPATAREQLATMLDEFVTDATERRWIEPRIAGLLGLAELPAEGREELFAAWRTLFERIAEVAPAILVFTDLHWADQGLLDFIEYLLGWARSSPVFVVALARPELLERRPDWAGSVRTTTRLNLEPLGDDHMQALLEGLLPGLPATALRSIIERAEGIPLYAVETVRMLLDTGALIVSEGRYQLKDELPQLAVAETLQALIAARLDANRPEDRSLLQDAAVLGLSFTTEALAAVNGADPPTLEAQLERLVRRQLLVQETDPRSPERGFYRFVQALVREVAYQSLARPDRRTRHLAAARFFEALGEDELAGVLASHYLDAFHASRPGPEADAVAVQARIALLGAADRAVALHSHRQAIAHLEQALTVTDDPAEQAAIHERITRSGEPAGALELGIEHGRTAVAKYREVGDGIAALRAATWLGRLQINFHVENEAAVTLRAAIDEAAPLGDPPELGGAYAELSRANMLNEEHEAAVVAADRALELAGRMPEPWIVVEALVTKGTSLSVIGRMTEAEATLRGAIDLADRHGLVPTSLRARNNLAGPIALNDQNESERLLREGYEMATRFGHRPFLYQFLLTLAESALRRGRFDDWIEEMETLEANEAPFPFYRSGFAGNRSMRLALRGDIAGAERHLEEASVIVRELQSSQADAYVNLHRAWLRFIAGRWQEAVEEARQAAVNSNFDVEGWWLVASAAAAAGFVDVLEEAIAGLEGTPYAGRTTDALLLAVRAALAARQGRWDEAAAGFDRARVELNEAGELVFAAITGLLWAAVAEDRSPKAAEAGSEAEEFFATRGALSFVHAYRAAFAPVGRQATTPSATSREATAPARSGATEG
jgi:class 3 adenylate cyclase/tetratricopeptide (TPR) repeat protein